MLELINRVNMLVALVRYPQDVPFPASASLPVLDVDSRARNLLLELEIWKGEAGRSLDGIGRVEFGNMICEISRHRLRVTPSLNGPLGQTPTLFKSSSSLTFSLNHIRIRPFSTRRRAVSNFSSNPTFPTASSSGMSRPFLPVPSILLTEPLVTLSSSLMWPAVICGSTSLSLPMRATTRAILAYFREGCCYDTDAAVALLEALWERRDAGEVDPGWRDGWRLGGLLLI